MVYAFSNKMRRLVQSNVNQPVLESSVEHNVYFNFPWDVIRGEVLDMGLADFRSPFVHEEYGTLSPARQVLLYCFSNMKRHFFEAVAHFDAEKDAVKAILAKGKSPVFVDIGCGPATAGLAFCEVFPGRTLAYYGVDRAAAMRNQARRLLKSAKTLGLLANSSKTELKDSWDELPTNFGKHSAVIVNFSYFFGSHFLQPSSIRRLAAWVKQVESNADTDKVLISYVNSPHPYANKKYAQFLSKIDVDYDADPEETTITFRTSHAATPKPTTFVHEVFEL